MKSQSLNTIDFYDSQAGQYWKSTVHLDLQELYKPFLKRLRPGSHILDAGCGSGRDAKAFLERGYRVTAIDASHELARLATAYTGEPCQVLHFQQMEFQEEFDGIWACASLLHVSRDEIHDVMSRFLHALRPGGIFYLSLKEGEGERVAEDGRFFCYYTADSFRRLLADFPTLHEVAFWRTEEMRSHNNRQPWLSFLLKKETSAT